MVPLQQTQLMPSIHISTIGSIMNYQLDTATQSSIEQRISELFNKEDFEKWLKAPSLYEADISSLAEQAKNCLIDLFPDSLVSTLQQFNNIPDPQMLIIKKLPFVGSNASTEAECFLLGVSALMNMKPFTYKSEHQGRLLHHVKANAKYEYSRSALSSRAELGLHVENAFDSNRPDNMALYCLVGDPGAKTTFYSISKLQSNLNLDLQERIMSVGKENQFIFEHPESHLSGTPGQGALFFETNQERVGTRFTSLLVKGQTEDAQKLIVDIGDFFKSEKGRADGYCLEKGDLILWSNHTILHGRSAYEPNYQPDKHRFLVRMYLSNDKNLPYSRD
jgi:L-asparagine oxygenase